MDNKKIIKNVKEKLQNNYHRFIMSESIVEEIIKLTIKEMEKLNNGRI